MYFVTINWVKRQGKKLSTPQITSASRCTSRSGQRFNLGINGFTLVELAVVLVILGTIYMSVLKVKSVITNAKVRQMVNMYRELKTAITVYKEKYGYLPGDDPYAVAHVGATHANPVATGGGDGTYNNPLIAEYLYTFEHLSKAGLIKGGFNGTNADNPTHPFNGLTAIGFHAITDASLKVLKSGNAIRFDNIPFDAAQAFDSILDDGKYDSGFIRGVDLDLSVIPLTILPRDYTVSGPVAKRFCVICFFE